MVLELTPKIPPNIPAKMATKARMSASVPIPIGETEADIKSIIMKNKRPEEKPKNNPLLRTLRDTVNVPRKTDMPIMTMVIGLIKERETSAFNKTKEKTSKRIEDKIKEIQTDRMIGFR